MGQYRVYVTEKLQRAVEVTAASKEDALKQVQESYDNEDIVLSADDFESMEMSVERLDDEGPCAIVVMDYSTNSLRFFHFGSAPEDPEAWLESHDPEWNENTCYYMLSKGDAVDEWHDWHCENR